MKVVQEHVQGESFVQTSSGGVTRGSSMNTQEIFLLTWPLVRLNGLPAAREP